MLLPLSLTYYLSFSFFILTELFGFVFHPLCTCSIFQQSITFSFPWVWVLGSPQHRSDWCSQWGPGDPVKLPPAPLYLWGSWYSHRSTATLSPGQGTASNIAHKASIRKCKAMYTHTHTLTQCNSWLPVSRAKYSCYQHNKQQLKQGTVKNEIFHNERVMLISLFIILWTKSRASDWGSAKYRGTPLFTPS